MSRLKSQQFRKKIWPLYHKNVLSFDVSASKEISALYDLIINHRDVAIYELIISLTQSLILMIKEYLKATSAVLKKFSYNEMLAFDFIRKSYMRTYPYDYISPNAY